MTEKDYLVTPPGRLVGGSAYRPNTTDAEGRPLVFKSGPNAGQPRVDYFLAVAIPKAGETHWAYTEWGAKIWAVGHAFMRNAGQLPKFAWKVTDGDDTTPNTKGRRPCDQTGYAGNWILKFSGSFQPGLYKDAGTTTLAPDGNDISPGDWIEVAGSVEANGSQQQPGVYLNHSMVNFVGYGERINLGPDPTNAGFGQAPVPQGVMSAPPSSGVNPAQPPASGGPAQPPAPGGPVPQPNYGFVDNAVPPPGGSPASPALAAPPKQMTAKANGATYEQFAAAGWTDAQMVEHGYMTP